MIVFFPATVFFLSANSVPECQNSCWSSRGLQLFPAFTFTTMTEIVGLNSVLQNLAWKDNNQWMSDRTTSNKCAFYVHQYHSHWIPFTLVLVFSFNLHLWTYFSKHMFFLFCCQEFKGVVRLKLFSQRHSDFRKINILQCNLCPWYKTLLLQQLWHSRNDYKGFE